MVVGLIEDSASILATDPLLSRAQPYQHAFSYLTPTMDMPLLLAFLEAQVVAKGGRVVKRRLASLDEAKAYGWLVVNCTGIHARWLCNDDKVYGSQGDVMLVECPGVDTAYGDEDHPGGATYIIPRTRHVVLGGTGKRVALAAAAREPPALACPEADWAGLREVARRLALTPGVPHRPGRACWGLMAALLQCCAEAERGQDCAPLVGPAPLPRRRRPARTGAPWSRAPAHRF